jgi:antimicrobial peptide system SdpB family protein
MKAIAGKVAATIAEKTDTFEPRGLPLAVARTALATAQLAVLAFNPDTALFVDTVETPSGIRCDGVRVASLWCLTDGADDGQLISRAIGITILAFVVSGFRPRWTCVPHWYVAFSMAACMPMANGGDRIAQIACMLLIPLCLGDDRRWQWTDPATQLPARWRGSAYAAQLAIRGQIVVIYAHAAVSKLHDPLWRHGSAMHIIALDPYFGLQPAVRTFLGPALESYGLIATVTWAVIAAQVVIAVTVLGGVGWRRLALVFGIGLHSAIALLMSLPVFGLVMTGLLVAGCAPFGSGGSAGSRRGGIQVAERRGRAVRSEASQ